MELPLSPHFNFDDFHAVFVYCTHDRITPKVVKVSLNTYITLSHIRYLGTWTQKLHPICVPCPRSFRWHWSSWKRKEKVFILLSCTFWHVSSRQGESPVGLIIVMVISLDSVKRSIHLRVNLRSPEFKANMLKQLLAVVLHTNGIRCQWKWSEHQAWMFLSRGSKLSSAYYWDLKAFKNIYLKIYFLLPCMLLWLFLVSWRFVNVVLYSCKAH